MEDWFSKINPRNTVPVLVSKENNIFYHSLSICVYLEQEFPEVNLLGNTNEEKGQIFNLINDIESNLFIAIADCLRNTSKALEVFLKQSAIAINKLLSMSLIKLNICPFSSFVFPSRFTSGNSCSR